MTAPFTPEQEKRVRELVGEWFAFDSDMLSVVPPDEVVTPIAVIPSRRFSARVLESAFGAPARKRISKNPPRDGGCLEG